MSKKVIFILGMHRSGTSALAGTVQLCGIPGGERLMQPSFDNERGFFENQDAVDINEAILQQLGLSWDSPFNQPEHWAQDSQMQRHKSAIRHFVATEMLGSGVFYIKDPRLCYTLPLWQAVLAEMGIQSQYLITVRQPEEVYQSLKNRNDIGRNHALALWLNHVLLAERNTRNFPRLFVQYDELLERPVQQVESILQAFHLKAENWEASRTQIKEFIDKKLKHQDAGRANTESSDLPYFTAVSTYLKTLSQSPDDQAVLRKMDEVAEQFLFNQGFFAPDKKQEFYATLKIESTGQSRMIAPLKIPVFEGLSELVFPLGHIKATIEKALVFPSNALSHVTLHFVRVKYADGSSDTLKPTENQAIIEHGNHYFFGGTNSLTIEPDAARKPREIVLGMRYEKLGKAALQSMAQINTDIKEWFYGQMEEQEEGFGQRLEKLSELVKSKDALLDQASQQSEELRAAFISYRNGKEQEIQELDSKLQAAAAELETAATELQAKDSSISQLNQAAAVLHQKAEGLASEVSILSSEKEHLTQKINGLHQEIDSLNQAVGNLNLEKAGLAQQVSRLTQNIETNKLEITGYKNALKKKDDLIWETYSRSQHFEKDYRQSLRTLDDIKTSFSYRLGWVLTAPLRFFYDLLSKKPINETPIWLAWQFVLAGLRMPGRMLSNINAQNIGTLQKALKNESPREIVGNLVKLLNGVPRGKGAWIEEKPVPPAAPALPVTAVLPATEKQNGQAAQPSEAPTVLNNAKQVVLFASPYLPDFDGSSGGKRATRMLGLLAEEFEVYAFTLGNKPEKHIQKLESLGVRVFRGNDFQEVKRLVPKVDTLIFSFFYTYFDCGKFLGLYPNARTIIDSVDVHWVRHERSRGLWPDLTDDIIQKKKALEIEIYQKADIVWAVTEQDKQAILQEVPGADVRIVSNVHSPVVTAYKDPGNNDLLFMGGFAHYPNIIAVKKLALDIFPKIKQEVGSARLVIAGSQAPQEVMDLGKLPGVEFLGFIEENSIGDLYKNAFLALAPLQAGAGIKGKICEAISYRVPVVTNSIGNEGIELANEKSGLVSDSDEELVKMTITALNRGYDLGKMTQAAQGKLYDLVGPKTVKKNMLESIAGPEVSICIVTWNKQKLLQRCIESIENNTQGIKYRILVYSNGCTDGTRPYLEAAAKLNPNIVPILSDTNDVFVIPNNRMVQLFPANDVVLLNNDTYVTDGWLTALRDAAYSSPEIGITGAKILYPDGKLQEFGSELYSDGTGRNIGKWDDPGKEEYNAPMYAGYVSGCAFYVKRATVDQIGFFDEDFHPCYCEDSDYCYTAWEHGIATLVTPDCVIYHDEGGTSGTDTSKGFKAYQKVNFEKFLKKHGGRLDEISSKIKLKNLAAATGNSYSHFEL